MILSGLGGHKQILIGFCRQSRRCQVRWGLPLGRPESARDPLALGKGNASGAQPTVSLFVAFKEAKQMENEKRHVGESLICFALDFSLASRGK